MSGIGAFISPGRSLERTLERVARADRLGFDAAYTTHIADRDSLTTLMAYAAASERIRLGTGVEAGLSDRMLSELAGIGTKRDVHDAVKRYQDVGVSPPGVGGIPGTDFDAGLEAVAELI